MGKADASKVQEAIRTNENGGMEMTFEEWALKKGLDLTRDLQGDYVDENTYFAYAGWQGAVGKDDAIDDDDED